MKRSHPFVLVPVLAAIFAAAPGWAASRSRGPQRIDLTYHGGALIQNAQVATLFWGSDWKDSSLTGYFNQFFQDLFTDGRYLANLAQYSVGNYTIGNGTFVGTATDDQTPPSTVHDSQIRTEIRAQIAAGHLPRPTEDTIYYVFTPPQLVVVDQPGADSAHDFAGYHDHTSGSDGFAYAVIPYDDRHSDPRVMTVAASHELAEAITDPEVGDPTLGWYDDRYGEVGDIPVSLYSAQKITKADLIDELTAADGTVYQVQKEWSNEANGPVAFAARAGA